jgi:hypothetical protein
MMASRRSGWLMVAGWLVLAGCGDSTDSESPKPNQPPALAGPESLAMKQGRAVQAALDVQDPDGDAVEVSVTPPAGIEAEVSPTLVLDAFADHSAKGALSIAVTLTDARGETAQASIGAEVAELGWPERITWTTSGPEAREHAAMIADDAGKRILMIGGSGYAPQFEQMLDDVWQFDLATKSWSEITPSGDVPLGAGSRRVAQIPGQSIAYLFGGYGPPGIIYQDLYRLDFSAGGAAFTKLEQVNAPGARALHGLAYDPESQRLFAFAGFGAGLFGDLWSATIDANTATWTQLAPESSPSPRYGFFYGVDGATGRVLLFSGAQSGGGNLNPARDTWMLDMRSEPPSWTLVLEGEDAGVPPGRRNGCAGWDPVTPRLFVFGGTADGATTAPGLFVLDARPGKESWTELALDGAPPLRSSGVAAYDAVNDRVWVGFGNSTALFRDFAAIGYAD